MTWGLTHSTLRSDRPNWRRRGLQGSRGRIVRVVEHPQLRPVDDRLPRVLPSARATTCVDATAGACHLPAYTRVCRKHGAGQSPHSPLTRLVCRVSTVCVRVEETIAL